MANIYIVSPSGAVIDKPAFRRGLSFLKKQGHTVQVDPDALSRHTRFAGEDPVRVAALERAAKSGADAVLITRGGYGLSRILPQLPYRHIQASIERGTQWVGFSDFTALQLAVLARTGGITWAGPALLASFGVEQPDDITTACFDDLLQEQGEACGWRMSVRHAAALATRKPGLWARDATLWGGNLAMLCSLVGTPYCPDIQGGVLFLEDVSEPPYRIERMLTQLLHAGILQKQKAIVLGQFTAYTRGPIDRGYDLASVIDWLRSQLRIPVLTDLPFGHVDTRVCLPVGARVDLLVEARDVLLVWGHV